MPSPKRPVPYTTRLKADDAVALLDHLGVAHVHVVSSSMGGMIAQELALAYPERIAHLVLFATLACPRPAIMDPWLTFPVQAEERRLDPTGMALCWLPWLFGPAFLVQTERVEEALAWQEPYPPPVRGLAAQADAVRAHDTRDRLAQIAAPRLVLVGAEDVVTPVYYSQELAAGIPGARVQILERGGRCAIWEYQEAGTEALLAFPVPRADDRPGPR